MELLNFLIFEVCERECVCERGEGRGAHTRPKEKRALFDFLAKAKGGGALGIIRWETT